MTDEQKAEFLAARCGKLTGSRMYQVLDMTAKGAEGAKRKQLKMELVAERMTGDSTPHYVNSAMQWGLDQEPHAKAAYELTTGCLIAPAWVVDHPDINWLAASPDGYIPEGVIEFKCPTTTTHLGWTLDRTVPSQHKPQILTQLACSGRKHAVFVSYDPRIRDPRKQLFIVEWEPKREEIEEIEEHARKFLAEVEELYQQLKGKS